MRTRRFWFFLVVGMAASSAASPPRAHATLGGQLDSVEADRMMLSATRHGATLGSGYTVEEMQAGGTTIREFVLPSGTVFGVAWTGIAHPDLSKLLGQHYPDYQQASESTPRIHGRRSRSVITDKLVVETWGRMRQLQGHAYLPSLVPSGVNPREIK